MPRSGSIGIEIAGRTFPIRYSGITSIQALPGSREHAFQFGSTGDSVVISEDAVVDNGIMRILSGGTSPEVAFTNPDDLVVVKSGSGTDSIDVTSVDSHFAGGLRLHGEFNDDALYGDFEVGSSRIGAGDLLNGGEGNDLLIGGAGRDGLSGLSGNDRLVGNSGAYTLVGGDGDDRLLGGGQADILPGNAGADLLRGHSHADTLDAGSGDSSLDPGDVLVLVTELDVLDNAFDVTFSRPWITDV